jgi:hypothetical protein
MLDLDFSTCEDYDEPESVTETFQMPERWTELRPHPKQQRFLQSRHRFHVVPAGRRSGKTEIAKRRIVTKALECPHADGRFIASAPTYNQAKRIYWKDLKRLVPDEFKDGRPSESELTIRLVNGAEIIVMGMEVPERVEGPPVDHVLLDEYGNMKEKVWKEHVRPALSDRNGTADLIGVPEGRNHYYDTFRIAEADDTGEWVALTWPSSDILPEAEIKAAKRDLDQLTYQQEYEASFVDFKGRVYYSFAATIHAVRKLKYDPDMPLVFCFDFNVAPGVAAVAQEFPEHTGIISEVYVPDNSNTPIVCRKLIADWKHHTNRIYCYGDPSGGQRGTAKVKGNDWDLIKEYLRAEFGDRVLFKVPKSPPRERVRVNAVNSRLMSMDGEVRLLVDPSCQWTIRDFEGVRIKEGSAGEIDKDHDKKLTHLTDAIGYYIERKHPVVKNVVTSSQY